MKGRISSHIADISEVNLSIIMLVLVPKPNVEYNREATLLLSERHTELGVER